MGNIVSVKESGVTTGVLDKGLQVAEDLISVTFTDLFGVPHTVFAHRDGPFSDPEAAVAAWENGTLHPFKEDPEPEGGNTSGKGGEG